MTFAAHVKGGTGAGRKVQKTRSSWQCTCVVGGPRANGVIASIGRKRNPGSLYSCPDCGTRRP